MAHKQVCLLAEHLCVLTTHSALELIGLALNPGSSVVALAFVVVNTQHAGDMSFFGTQSAYA